MKQRKFLYCHHCGNLLGLIHDAGVPISCCGELMQEPNLVDIKDGCRIHADGQTTVVDMNFPRNGIPQWVYLQTDVVCQSRISSWRPWGSESGVLLFCRSKYRNDRMLKKAKRLLRLFFSVHIRQKTEFFRKKVLHNVHDIWWVERKVDWRSKIYDGTI